nr:hypothetical protein [Tanacetum cinerariifolium]
MIDIDRHAAKGFEQIIDFLRGSYIHYALTLNPHIYISCIKQFWNTASVERSDDATRLQALVDKKKIVLSENVIREILQLDDAEGVVCLPNEDIFAEEGIAEAQVQADDVVAADVEENVVEDKLEIIKLQARVKRLERANKVKSSKLRRLRKVGASRRVESSDDMDKDEGIELVKNADITETEGRHAAEQAKKQAEIYNLDLDHSSKVLSIKEDNSEVQEVVEVVTTAKLMTNVVTAASHVSAASVTISAAKPTISRNEEETSD